MYELYNSILVRPHLDVVQRRYVKYHRLTANVSIESSSFLFLYLYLSLSLSFSFSLYLSRSMIPKHYT